MSGVQVRRKVPGLHAPSAASALESYCEVVSAHMRYHCMPVLVRDKISPFSIFPQYRDRGRGRCQPSMVGGDRDLAVPRTPVPAEKLPFSGLGSRRQQSNRQETVGHGTPYSSFALQLTVDVGMGKRPSE
ncbi:MAG: hypothetical protein L6R35_001485 [Caloplaca aegaea]|nr:MAG: hypothetical protein L6R35_001485 [Caloplaca aegaea]